MNPAQELAILSHIAKLPLRCPMCNGFGPENWALHGNFVYLPELDDDFKPTPGGFPVILVKCKRCRYVAPFRATGPSEPEDLSAT